MVAIGRGSQRAKADRHPRSEGRQSHSAVRQWSGTEAKIDGKEFLIMKEEWASSRGARPIRKRPRFGHLH